MLLALGVATAPGLAQTHTNTPAADPILPYPTVAPSLMVAADYDGDGRTDAAVWGLRTTNWIIRRSDGTGTAIEYGRGRDLPVPADYDGDGRADVAIYRYWTGEWILAQSTLGSRTVAWGTPEFGDVPVPTDYDGDGLTDFGVYRTATGQWYVALSGGGTIGATLGDPSADVPVVGDFDGDGKGDFTVYGSTTGRWLSLLSGGGTADQILGSAADADIPAAADYDGDGRTDRAVYRSSTGQWIVQASGGGEPVVRWGDPSQGDMPIPADYDGDGNADIAVYRNSNGTWFILRSSDYQMTAFGWGSPAYFDRARVELRPPFSLLGKIVSAASGDPIPGARVEITSAPYSGVAANTDPSGDYLIAPLTRGELTVLVTAPGYFSQTHTIGFYGHRRVDVALTAQPFPPLVVINEFRPRGPNGGSDEFIELRNIGSSAVNLSGWFIRVSHLQAGSIGPAILPAVELGPGCHFLLGNSNPGGYTGPVDGTVWPRYQRRRWHRPESPRRSSCRHGWNGRQLDIQGRRNARATDYEHRPQLWALRWRHEQQCR